MLQYRRSINLAFYRAGLNANPLNYIILLWLQYLAILCLQNIQAMHHRLLTHSLPFRKIQTD
jgi:hypothetical protein